MNDTIYRQAVLDLINADWKYEGLEIKINNLPPAEPEYKPVTAEDFAKTMSENTLYGFMAWHGEALELMERQGFVICKKT